MIKNAIIGLLDAGKDPFPGIIGQQKTKFGVLSAIVAGRHICILGYPGVGKTTLAKQVAALLPEIDVVKGCPFHCDPTAPVCPQCKGKDKLETAKSAGVDRFVRVQGSPDLRAEDLLGDIDPIKAMKYGPNDPRAFTPGKLLRANGGVLFFDEINRCPERLQNSMLQVLEEGVATLGGYEVDYPANFILIATMNPAEYVGTERMSEVLLDRFDMIEMEYPETKTIETQVLLDRGAQIVEVPKELTEFIVKIVRKTRTDERIERPAGVRATLGLYERAQTMALLRKRDKVDMQDVIDVVHSVLDHRIKLSSRFKHVLTPKQVIEELMQGKSPAEPAKSGSASAPSKPTDWKDLMEKKDEAEMLEEMTNRDIGYLNPTHLSRIILADVYSAEQSFGKKVIEMLTGANTRQLQRMQGNFQFRSKLVTAINEKMKRLTKDGLMDEDGLTQKGVELIALHAFFEEIERVGELKFGEHEGKQRGGDGDVIEIRPYHKGDGYKAIDVRSSMRVAMKRGHRDIHKNDLRSNVRCKSVSVDFSYVLDASGSMKGAKMDAVKKAALALAYMGMQEGDRVSVVSFNKDAELITPLTDNIIDIARKIMPLRPGKGTDLAKAIREARISLEDSQKDKHIILISDAIPTEGVKPVEKALEETSKTAAEGITISIIGIDLDADGKKIAQEISGIGDGTFYHIDDPSQIRGAVLEEHAKVSARSNSYL